MQQQQGPQVDISATNFIGIFHLKNFQRNLQKNIKDFGMMAD